MVCKISGEYIGTGKDVFIELPLGRWNVFIKPKETFQPQIDPHDHTLLMPNTGHLHTGAVSGLSHTCDGKD